MTYLYRRAIGKRTNEQFEIEFERWKNTAAKHEGDEYYMFSWRDSLQKRRPPPMVAHPPTVERIGERRKRTLSYQADKLMGRTEDPY